MHCNQIWSSRGLPGTSGAPKGTFWAKISRAERTKFVKEVIKESSPMKMPELFIENWPRRGHDGSWVGIKV